MSDRAPGTQAEDELLAARFLLSRWVGQGSLRRLSWWLCRLLAGVSSDPAALVRQNGWPAPTSACRRLGLSGEAIELRFRRVAKTHAPLLDDEILDAFVPRPLQPVLEELIREGYDLAAEAVETLLRELADGLSSEGPVEPLREGSITNLRTAFVSLARELNALRLIEPKLSPSPTPAPDRERAFAGWVSADYRKLPRASKLGARPANTDTSAPPLRFIRLALRGLDWEVEQRRAAGNRKLFRALRGRALLAVAVLGFRPEALARMVGDDVSSSFVFPDGEVGPAIMANPRKTVHASIVRPKALTDRVYGWVCEYKEYAGVQPQGPLWLANLNPRTELSSVALSRVIASLLDRPPERELRLNPYYRAIGDAWPTRRISATKMRHFAEIHASLSGLDFAHEHREELARPYNPLPGDPQIFADALLDHAMAGLPARYKDAASEAGRARYGLVASLGIYDYVLGSRGARRSIDPTRVKEAQEAFSNARTHEVGIESEIDRIERKLTAVEIGTLSTEKRDLYMAELAQSLITLLRSARELNAAGKRTEKAAVELKRARMETMPIDDLSDPVPAGALPALEQEAEPELPIEREYAWPDEFRRAVGENILPPSTLRRWMSGKTRHPPGDRRNLIEPDMIETISTRVRRIRLDKLDWSRFPESVQERLDAIRRTPDPRRT